MGAGDARYWGVVRVGGASACDREKGMGEEGGCGGDQGGEAGFGTDQGAAGECGCDEGDGGPETVLGGEAGL